MKTKRKQQEIGTFRLKNSENMYKKGRIEGFNQGFASGLVIMGLISGLLCLLIGVMTGDLTFFGD